MKIDAGCSDRCSSDDIDECRYKYLLQPIKDIASNWDIDIADSLSEYLEELDQLRISVGDGRSSVNFAEAALLIQGSAVVYSRKVEHLHSLVLRSLDCIARKTASSSSKDKQVNARGSAIEDADILLFDSDPSFLLLDHVIEEGNNIDLRSKQLVAADKDNLQNNSNNSRISLNGSYSCEASRVSMSLLHSLIHDNYDYDQGNASLKLSTSVMDDSGALLLCGSLRPMPMSSGHNNTSRSSWLGHCHAQSSMPENKSAVVEDPRLMNDAMDYDDDGTGNNNHFEYDGGIDEHEASIDRVATPKKASASSSLFSSERPQQQQQPSKDWFAQLDPHQSVEGSKEIRKGKNYKVPGRLLHPKLPDAVFVYPYIDHAEDEVQSLLRLNQVPRRGLFDVTLAPILRLRKRSLYRLEKERAVAAGNREGSGSTKSKQQQLSLSDEDRRLDRLWTSEEGGDEMEQLWTNDFANMGDDEEDYVYPTEELEARDKLADFRSFEIGAAPAQEDEVGSDYVSNEEDELARRLEKVLSDDLSSSSRSSYESICQQYISDFNKGADLFARETQLSRRVSEWTRRLEPILQLQEEGPQFDIRSYCDELMARTESIARQCPERSIISFREVAHGKSSVEVGRMFLSCLQLTNQGDLDIVLGESAEGLVPVTQINNFCISLKPTCAVASGRCKQSENSTCPTKSRIKRRDPHRKVHFSQEPSLLLLLGADTGRML